MKKKQALAVAMTAALTFSIVGSTPPVYAQESESLQGMSIEDNAQTVMRAAAVNDIFSVAGINYTITSTSNNEVAVSGADFNVLSTGEVVVPDTVTYDGVTYTVTSVASRAFANNNDITSIDMSGCTALTAIGGLAFNAASNLETILFPESLTTLADFLISGTKVKEVDLSKTKVTSLSKTFGTARNLENVKLPATLQIITNGAFSGCDALKTLDLSNTQVDTISGEYTFNGSNALTTIILPKNVPVVNWEKGIRINNPNLKIYGWSENQLPEGNDVAKYFVGPPTLGDDLKDGGTYAYNTVLTGLQADAEVYVDGTKAGTVDQNGTYRLTLSPGSYEMYLANAMGVETQHVKITVVQSQTSLDAKTKKGNVQTKEFAYGDTITVEVTPEATAEPVQTNSMLRSAAPTESYVALFYNNEQISDSVGVASGETAVLTYDTTQNKIMPSSTDPAQQNITLEVRYVGNTSMASTAATVNISLSKANSRISITAASKAYTGSPVALVKDTDYTVSGSSKEVTFTWEKQDGDTWTALTGAPAEVGTYRVTAQVAGDDYYRAAQTSPVTFRITQAKNQWTQELSIQDWTYGQYDETKNAPSASAQYGDVNYTYSKTEYGTYTDEVPTEAGDWYVKAEVAETQNYTGLSAVKKFTINQAVAPEITLPANLNAVQDDRLSSVALPDGWTWGDGTQTVTVNNSGYAARLNVDDKNYDYTNVDGYDARNHRVERTLQVLVSQGSNAWITRPVISDWTYGEKADTPRGSAEHGTVVFTYSDAIDGTFSAEKPENAGIWYMKASVAESAEYAGLEDVIVKFEIEQASPTYSVPNDVTATYGQTLADVELPDGFVWENENMSVGDIGTHNFMASYVPEDSVNYKTITGIRIAVTVGKATAPAIVLPDNLSAVQDAPLSSIELPQGWTWADETQTVSALVKEYAARLTVDDTRYDYSQVEGYDADGHYVERKLNVSVAQGTNQWTKEPAIADWTYGEAASVPSGKAAHGTVEFTYSDSQTGEFSSEVPETSGTWYMKASVAASEEYSGLNRIVSFTIHKAAPTYNVPENLSAVYGQTLADVELPDGFTWTDDTLAVGNAGDNVFEAVYTPADTDNYETVKNIKVSVTVEPKKADAPGSTVNVPEITENTDLEKLQVTDADTVLISGTDYDISTERDGNVVTVTFTFKGNYTGIIARTYEVTPEESETEESETEESETTESETEESETIESETEESETIESETEESETIESETEESETIESETEESETIESETGESETIESETEESETIESETEESETIESETEESETIESETGESETIESETGESETIESETGESETIESETEESETIESETEQPETSTDTKDTGTGTNQGSGNETSNSGTDTPKTGDNVHLGLWGSLFAVSGGLVAILTGKKRKRSRK